MSTSTIPTYGGATATPTTTTTAPAPTVQPTTGTFPGASNGDSLQSQLAAIQQQFQAEGLTPSQFFAAYAVSSTEQPLYLGANNTLNANAYYLAWYKGATQAERQSVQSQMADVGAIPQTDATGLDNSAALSAFSTLLGSSSALGTNVFDYLNANSTGQNAQITATQNAISENLTKAQAEATAPIVATVENPTTLSATLTSAFEQALGYSPDQAQIQSFINQVQGQDTAYASAPRAEAQAQIAQAHSEESALNKLGPDGIDTVIQAYQAAISGTKLPGAGTVQGPVTGSIPSAPTQAPGSQGATIQSNEAANASPAGSRLPAGVAEYNTPQGTQVGANLLPTPDGSVTNYSIQPRGVLGTIDNSINNGFIGSAARLNNLFDWLPGVPHQNVPNTGPNVVTTQQTKYKQRYTTAPGAPTGATAPTYGGLYALSAADWKEVQTLYPLAKKYATPGAAPQSVQQAAFTSLLSNAYDNNGNSWSKAIASIASGTPFATAEGTNLSAFGNQVAAEVNSQIEAVQNQVNNDAVTVKVSAPDATAEANLAAKQSDPASYEAAQTASWGEVLNKMLAGAPSFYDQTSADTFTGPVSPEAASTPLSTTGGNV